MAKCGGARGQTGQQSDVVSFGATRRPAAGLGLSKILVEFFIQSSKEAPLELILDFEATDDWVLAQQEGRAFHGYYGDWCFLPICVFYGEQLLVSYLRPSNADPARHAWAILNLLVTPLRQEWPQVKKHLPDNLPVLAGYARKRSSVWLRLPAQTCVFHGSP